MKDIIRNMTHKDTNFNIDFSSLHIGDFIQLMKVTNNLDKLIYGIGIGVGVVAVLGTIVLVSKLVYDEFKN